MKRRQNEFQIMFHGVKGWNAWVQDAWDALNTDEKAVARGINCFNDVVDALNEMQSISGQEFHLVETYLLKADKPNIDLASMKAKVITTYADRMMQEMTGQEPDTFYKVILDVITSEAYDMLPGKEKAKCVIAKIKSGETFYVYADNVEVDATETKQGSIFTNKRLADLFTRKFIRIFMERNRMQSPYVRL